MKENYEKPEIESEEFSLEMMQAVCEISKGDAYGYSLYPVLYPGQCEGCAQTGWTNS
jgi:hypothetical protein